MRRYQQAAGVLQVQYRDVTNVYLFVHNFYNHLSNMRHDSEIMHHVLESECKEFNSNISTYSELENLRMPGNKNGPWITFSGKHPFQTQGCQAQGFLAIHFTYASTGGENVHISQSVVVSCDCPIDGDITKHTTFTGHSQSHCLICTGLVDDSGQGSLHSINVHMSTPS